MNVFDELQTTRSHNIEHTAPSRTVRDGALSLNPNVACRRTRLGRALRSAPAAFAVAMLGCAFLANCCPPASAQVLTSNAAGLQATAQPGEGGSSLEAAASKAGETGRKVAMSLIGLAFAIAGIVLAFRRDFKEAAGVFAVGIVAVLLATPAGLSLLRDTVSSLFGSA
jgi:hypothetical protein